MLVNDCTVDIKFVKNILYYKTVPKKLHIKRTMRKGTFNLHVILLHSLVYYIWLLVHANTMTGHEAKNRTFVILQHTVISISKQYNFLSSFFTYRKTI